MGEDGECNMDDGGGDDDDVEEKHEEEVFALEEGVEEACKEDEGEGKHKHGEHHEPLGVEYVALAEHGGDGPEEGNEAEEGESYGYGSHFKGLRVNG